METELRTMPGEVRADGDQRRIVGRAIVYEQLSEELMGFRERFLPGAFSGSLARDDIRALVGHNDVMILGRNRSGTLRLSETDAGVYVEIDAPDTGYARDLIASIERRDITGFSFRFITRTDNFRREDGKLIREVSEARLLEVSPVAFPAYPQTEASVRSRDLFLERESADTSGRIELLQVEFEHRERHLRLTEIAIDATTRSR